MKSERKIIKVCGLREANYARIIATLPEVDWIGLIFHPHSPRRVAPDPQPWQRLKELPAQRVGVFVDANVETVFRKAREYGLDRIQLHGKESPEYCAAVSQRFPVIKAIAVDQSLPEAVLEAYHGNVDAFLFDAAGPAPGGNGRVFHWEALKAYQGPTPFLLAGGIGPGTEDALEAFAHPFWMGIDLNSKFETLPGVKNIHALRSFFSALPDRFRGAFAVPANQSLGRVLQHRTSIPRLSKGAAPASPEGEPFHLSPSKPLIHVL